MIKRVGKNLSVLTAEVPAASVQLERDGYAVLRDVLTADEVAALRGEIDATFEAYPAERNRTDRDEFRYEMVNRGALSQAAIGHERILEVIEPLLGDDCHLIANTAWRNFPDFGGGPWHCDAGPHVPRPEGIDWDDRIPYPVFAIGAHIMLQDCPVVVRAHRGRAGKPSLRPSRSVRSTDRSRPHLRRASAGAADR